MKPKLQLSNMLTTFLFIYFLTLLIIGISASIYLYTLINELSQKNDMMIVLSIVSMSAVGSSIYYIRKLYKSCINKSIEFTNRDKTYIPQIGSLMYFISRPFFGMAFAFVAYLLWQTTLSISVKGPTTRSDTFLLIAMLIGFFSGFLSGRLISQYESIGMKMISKLGSSRSRDE